MAKNVKPEIITFKADAALAEAMRSIPNRSEFIRQAILEALGKTCPLCGGTGILEPDAYRHWERFARTHQLQECKYCHAHHLVCLSGGRGD